MQQPQFGVMEYLIIFFLVALAFLVVFGLYWLIRAAVRSGMRDAARDAEKAKEAEKRD